MACGSPPHGKAAIFLAYSQREWTVPLYDPHSVTPRERGRACACAVRWGHSCQPADSSSMRIIKSYCCLTSPPRQIGKREWEREGASERALWPANRSEWAGETGSHGAGDKAKRERKSISVRPKRHIFYSHLFMSLSPTAVTHSLARSHTLRQLLVGSRPLAPALGLLFPPWQFNRLSR